MSQANKRNIPQSLVASQIDQATSYFPSSIDVVTETANLVEKLQRMPQNEKNSLLLKADETIQMLIDALNSNDIETAESILDGEIILLENSLDQAESLMIALLKRGFFDYGWSTCAFLLNLRTEKQAIYLQEFFLYFEKIQNLNTDKNIQEDSTIIEIQSALKSFIHFYLTTSEIPRIPNIFSAVLEIAFFFNDTESAIGLFRRGVDAGEQKIAFVFAKLLTDAGLESAIESIADVPLTVDQDFYFTQFLLSKELRTGDGSKIERLRQKLVSIYAIKGNNVPKFPLYSQLGYQAGVENLFLLQEEISGKILSDSERSEILSAIHQSNGESSYSLADFLLDPHFLDQEEQTLLQKELLIIQFTAFELCSIEAMEQYIDIINGLFGTTVGENFLHMFFVKFASPSVLRPLLVQSSIYIKGESKGGEKEGVSGATIADVIIEPKFQLNTADLSLSLYVFSHCIYISNLLQEKGDVGLLKKILALLKKHGDQETINIDGDVPELQKIEKKIVGLESFSESLSQFSIEGQQYFYALEKQVKTQYGEYDIRKCIVFAQHGVPINELYSNELLLFVCLRSLFSGEINTEYLRFIENIDLNMVSEDFLALLSITILHFDNIYSHPKVAQSMLISWYFKSAGSSESIYYILEYLISLSDSNDEYMNDGVIEFVKTFLEEASSDGEILVRDSLESFARLMIDGYLSTERSEDEINRILARAKYLDDDFVGAMEIINSIHQVVPEDRLFILKVQTAINGYTWTGSNELMDEWNTTRSLSSFRDVCRMHAKNSNWKEFDKLVVEAHNQSIPFAIEAYFIALDELFHSNENWEQAGVVYSLLQRLYQYPIEQVVLAPENLRYKIHAWAYQACNGELETFYPSNGQLLFLYSILCKEKVSGNVPTEKFVNIYWSIIEKALVSRKRFDIEMLVSHYERRFTGYITTDSNKSETIEELFDAIREDMEEFFTLLQYEPFAFSKIFVAKWLRQMILIISTHFKKEEYVELLLERSEGFFEGVKQEALISVSSYGSRYIH